MPHINLLPWREELRKEREQRFGAWAGIALAITGVIFGGIHFFVATLIEHQNERIAYLNEQIKEAEKKIEEIKELEAKRDRLFARMKIIQELQASRPEVVHLFDELVRTLADGVYYTSLEQKGKTLNLTGIAQSSARVTTLMRQLEDSLWLKNVLLKIVESKESREQKSRKVGEFALQVEQDAPKKAEDETKAGKKK